MLKFVMFLCVLQLGAAAMDDNALGAYVQANSTVERQDRIFDAANLNYRDLLRQVQEIEEEIDIHVQNGISCGKMVAEMQKIFVLLGNAS